MENESGREFRIEIGRFETPQQEEPSQLPDSGEQSPEAKLKREASQKVESGDLPADSQPPAQPQWVRYWANQLREDSPFDSFKTKEGVCLIQGLTFKVNEDLGERTIKSGTYELIISDVTKNLPPRMKIKTTRICLKLVDLDEEASLAVQQQQQEKEKKAPAGKKK
jgi:hypothetical protein